MNVPMKISFSKVDMCSVSTLEKRFRGEVYLVYEIFVATNLSLQASLTSAVQAALQIA